MKLLYQTLEENVHQPWHNRLNHRNASLITNLICNSAQVVKKESCKTISVVCRNVFSFMIISLLVHVSLGWWSWWGSGHTTQNMVSWHSEYFKLFKLLSKKQKEESSLWPSPCPSPLKQIIKTSCELYPMLLNQTWVHSPTCSKANLLTPGCGEGKCSIYCKAP